MKMIHNLQIAHQRKMLECVAVSFLDITLIQQVKRANLSTMVTYYYYLLFKIFLINPLYLSKGGCGGLKKLIQLYFH
jgi:hypothetical protein